MFVCYLFGVAGAILLLGAAEPGLAQQAGGSKPTPPPPVQVPVDFGAEPVLIESIGMQMYLPVDATIQTRFIRGGQSRSLIQTADQRWVMYVENKVAEKDLSPRDILDGVIKIQQQPFQIRDPKNPRGAGRSAIEVLDRTDDLQIGGLEAARAYIGQPADSDYPVTGYTILRMDPGQYVVFQFTTPLPNFPSTRTIFEAITATAHFPDRAEKKEDRVEAVGAGAEFLASVTPEEMERALDETPMFMRVYRPSPTGSPSDSQEIGYQRLTVRKGQRGELDPDKPRTSWTVQEREYGFVVQMQARVLISDVVVDTRAIFYLSSDRKDEMWSIVIEEKGKDKVGRLRINRTKQTLARDGDELRVLTTLPGSQPEEKGYQILEDHYLSAVERYLLPRLVAQRAASGGPAQCDLAFYNFDPQRSVVTLRRERFDRTPEGGWLCLTTPSEGQPDWTTTYDAAGRLVQRTVPGATGVTILEPTTRERLQKIWAKKNLPIDD